MKKNFVAAVLSLVACATWAQAPSASIPNPLVRPPKTGAMAHGKPAGPNLMPAPQERFPATVPALQTQAKETALSAEAVRLRIASLNLTVVMSSGTVAVLRETEAAGTTSASTMPSGNPGQGPQRATPSVRTSGNSYYVTDGSRIAIVGCVLLAKIKGERVDLFHEAEAGQEVVFSASMGSVGSSYVPPQSILEKPSMEYMQSVLPWNGSIKSSGSTQIGGSPAGGSPAPGALPR